MNRWGLAFFYLSISNFPVWGDEGLRIPRGSTSTVIVDKGGATVHYPFGKVEIPRESVWKEKTEVVPLGKLHAKTQGTFRLLRLGS
ncbi:MAG: hypothetical protein IPN90_02165 [Elusimicrobia bacterium]|nr:hypothetical protein [Elusimicrobiota bacterium]